MRYPLKDRLRRFARDESGVALVEFAIILPLTLLVFAVVVEGSRMFWSYQTAIAGVRDATRYLARVAPADICTAGGTIATHATGIDAIVRNNIGGQSLFPTGISVTSVTPSLSCINGTYRIPTVSVVEVTAILNITFPFSDLMTFAGYTPATITTRIADQHRIFGT